MYAASSESRKQASRPASSGDADAPEGDEPRHLGEEALPAAEVLPGGRVEGRVDPPRAEGVDPDALAAVVAGDLPGERHRSRLGDGIGRELRFREQRGVGGRDADRPAAGGAQMRYRGAADDGVSAHVDGERTIEIGRARMLHRAADLHADVRPHVVEATERPRSGGDELLQSAGIRRIDLKRRGAELGGERVDAGRVDVAESEPIAAGGQQPGAGVADSRRASEHQCPPRHRPGF